MTDKEANRFAKYVQFNPISGCWEWQGHCKGGYGEIRLGLIRTGDRRKERVHRASYEHFIGPIPNGCLSVISAIIARSVVYKKYGSLEKERLC